MYMQPNNAHKNIWLSAQTLNQKLKENAQTQDAYGRQAFLCVIYDIFRAHISTLILLLADPPSCFVSAKAQAKRHATL